MQVKYLFNTYFDIHLEYYNIYLTCLFRFLRYCKLLFYKKYTTYIFRPTITYPLLITARHIFLFSENNSCSSMKDKWFYSGAIFFWLSRKCQEGCTCFDSFIRPLLITFTTFLFKLLNEVMQCRYIYNVYSYIKESV